MLTQLIKLPRALFTYARDGGYRKYIHGRWLPKLGYSLQHWNRVIQVRDWHAFIARHDATSWDALEISPGLKTVWRESGFRSYRAVQYPEFDICTMTLDQGFDIIIADNVFEHLRDPDRAGANVYSMLRTGGWFLIATPFLYRIHGSPFDFQRWTCDGQRQLLIRAGFQDRDILTTSWGNLKCVKASLRQWQYFGWQRDLSNDPSLPIIVWSFAQKTN